MPLIYYSNFIDNINKNSFERRKNDSNALLQSQWDDSSLITTVKEETRIGSFDFKDIEVWKYTVTEYTSNIIKNADDFRKLLFKDCYHEVRRGTFFSFDNAYWISYSSTEKEDAYSEVLVRRCNNYVKWIDEDTGEIISIPCILDYNISATNPKVDKDVITAFSSTQLVLQYNERTKKLKRNDRFIFNGIPYKYVAINNYLQDSYLDDSTTMVFIDIDFDLEKPYDDIENNIADRFLYDYKVNVTPDVYEQHSGFSGKIIANITLNGELTDKIPTFKAMNRNVIIDEDGNYELIGDSGIALIRVSFGSFYSDIEILINNEIEDRYEIFVSPNIYEIYESESVELEASIYNNGTKIDGDIMFESFNAEDGSYSIIKNGNLFTVTNIRCSKFPLKIRFYHDDIENIFEIKLRPLF